MKLADIEESEIRVVSLYVITCFLCEKQTHFVESGIDSCVGDAVAMAASQGWHSYETDDETCGAACPDCIKDVRENLAETTEDTPA